MAFSAARSRLFGLPNRNRSSSPREDEFATADGFDTEQDALMHSTAQLGDGTTGQPLPQLYQHYQHQAYIGDETQGSTEMSIEIGRGIANDRRPNNDDHSLNATFELGDNSLYDVASTPPMRLRDAKPKADVNLRREASVRKASQNMKKTSVTMRDAGTTKSRTLSEALGRSSGVKITDNEATIPPRNTRFSRTRVPSGNQHPTYHMNEQPVQPTVTANSFMLPDLPNITELVSGTRKDGTPVFSRTAKSQSRFTSNTSRALRPEHAPIIGASIPDDEKAIYASLQLLKEKNTKLEADYATALQRASDLETEIVGLRSQLRQAIRQPQPHLADHRGMTDNKDEKLRVSVETLELHLAQCRQDLSKCRSERERAVRDRDQLITQAGVAYYNLEEVKNENDELKKMNESLLREVEQLKQDMAQSKGPGGLSSTGYLPEQSADDLENAEEPSQPEHAQDLDLRIAREVQRHRDIATNATSKFTQKSRSRSRSKSRSRIAADVAQGQVVIGAKDQTLQKFDIPGNETRDLTELSVIDINAVANLRKKLEEELRNRRTKHRASATSQPLPRKSSMKDVTVGLENIPSGGAEGMTKTVRLQSPQPGDAISQAYHDKNDTGNVSKVSNTSRRRRRSSTDGMTSAFIVPDITLHANSDLAEAAASHEIQHDAAACTVCQGGVENVKIPLPQSVNLRAPIEDVDITSATVRPSQSPVLALASVVKQLEDEIAHLKLQLAAQLRLYSQHDPALSRRRRLLVKSRMDKLGAEIERRSEQIYALYDVLEGQRQGANGVESTGDVHGMPGKRDLEETLTSIGLDPARLSGHVSRAMPLQAEDGDERFSDEELPWEGLSDYCSEDERI